MDICAMKSLYVLFHKHYGKNSSQWGHCTHQQPLNALTSLHLLSCELHLSSRQTQTMLQVRSAIVHSPGDWTWYPALPASVALLLGCCCWGCCLCQQRVDGGPLHSGVRQLQPSVVLLALMDPTAASYTVTFPETKDVLATGGQRLLDKKLRLLLDFPVFMRVELFNFLSNHLCFQLLQNRSQRTLISTPYTMPGSLHKQQ